MYDHVLVAYDGSAESGRALTEGLKLAAVLGARITIATVSEPLPGFYNMASVVAPEIPGQLREEQYNRLKALQVSALAMTKAHGISAKSTLLEASEVEGILSAARSLNADLLVVGLPKHAAGPQWAGTVRQIANETSCPILAVP